jgi:UrcA family protein
MTITTSKCMQRTGLAALILAVGALASPAILAAETEIGAVTIRAKRATKTVVGHTSSGIPVVMYELGYQVSYKDLDLATPSGADTLKARVREAAKSACTDLDRLYPAGAPERNCAIKAADDAMSQVNAAIAAAQKK